MEVQQPATHHRREERLEHYLGTPTADGSTDGSDNDDDGATDDEDDEGCDLPSLLDCNSDNHSADEEAGTPWTLTPPPADVGNNSTLSNEARRRRELQPYTATQGGAQQQYMTGQQVGALSPPHQSTS